MVNYTNRVMTAIEKSNYSMNVQVICDQNKRVIYFFAGMPGSCHDLTCLRRSSLWGRLGSAQLFDNGQYLLGDSGYIPLDRHVCSYKRTGDDMDKVDFNTCIAHARVGNEHFIGILKARWVLESAIDIVQNDSDKSVEEATPPRSARAPPVQVPSSSTSPDRLQDLSSRPPDRVQDLTSSSPEGRQVSHDPRDIPSSSSSGRHQVRPLPTDIPSSSNPGRRKQASPTRAVRPHSPESSLGGAPSTLSDHATRSGSPSSPDRQEPDDNEPLAGFAEPMVPYPPSDDEQVEAVAVLTSLAASYPSPASKGKRPVLHKSSSESEEIRFVRPDGVKRRVADPDDDAGGPVSQQLAHIWSHEHCTAYQTTREQHKDSFLQCKSVQPFLNKFRGHKGDDISYVQANWQAAQAQDPIANLAGYWAPLDERDEEFLWSNCTAADRQKFLAELNGHRLKLAAQKAMQFAIADADQPSQTQDGAGPSNSSWTASTELGRPIFPTPLSAASLVSNAEILLAGCRDDDMELSRLHGDYS
ncbi:hypothetical protein R1sor_016884 [Riccia sorocarpa]|uniref:DDE Tnp4 domain-containing protein n=1 Tax=Riccia sorocarpa TaxID=122646 RepID=A0ABD3HKE7_9MARC